MAIANAPIFNLSGIHKRWGETLADIVLTCPVCRQDIDLNQGAFTCPRAEAGEEHSLRKKIVFNRKTLSPADNIANEWSQKKRRSFVVFRRLLGSYHLLGDEQYLNILNHIEQRLTELEGSPFLVTPCRQVHRLAQSLNRQGSVWIKDDTRNITGSHKGRHLMGTLLYLEALRESKGEKKKRVLAIYSCGNAALGAAAVARAGGYELHAFVPEDVNATVEAMLVDRSVVVEKIPRTGISGGDPCYREFRRAVDEKGWIPFSCSGNDNWSNIDGGETLGWELAMQLKEKKAAISSLIVQVGGGALGRAIVQAWQELHRLGLVDELPRIYACQPAGGFPFVRAYYLVLKAIAEKSGFIFDLVYDRRADPSAELNELKRFSNNQSGQVRNLAAFVKENFDSDEVKAVLWDAAKHRGKYMWAWDGGVPVSLAHGILDDETYDWYELLCGILKTGGKAEILREETISEAHRLADTHTDMEPCPTATAGLAGLLQLHASEDIPSTENVGLLFTGINR